MIAYPQSGENIAGGTSTSPAQSEYPPAFCEAGGGVIMGTETDSFYFSHSLTSSPM